MLFQVGFAQNLDLLQKVRRNRCLARGLRSDMQSLDLLTTACNDLRNAKMFRELLNIILMMGNYLNGTNYAGGAFGFKIASINRVRLIGYWAELTLTLSWSTQNRLAGKICSISSKGSLPSISLKLKASWTSW